MTVAELMKQLQAMPQDAPVVVLHNSVRIQIAFVELRTPTLSNKPIVFVRTTTPHL